MRKHAWSACTIVFLALFSLSKALPETVSGSCDTRTVVASKIENGLVIALLSATGKLKATDDSLCVVLRKIETGDLVEIQHVSIDFVLLVGRIQERPITVQFTPDGKGYHFGVVDLGRQYYHSASYYAIVRYVDSAGKKRKTRFHLTVT